MTSDVSRPSLVFISYSHDSLEHADRVLALSDHLRADGIDCVLDQYEESPPEGFPRWMERQISGADFVLMICTPTYYRRVMGEEEPGKGHGVAWETTLIHQYIYNAGTLNKRFIPVLLEGAREEDIPVPWQGVKYYRPETTQGYEELYRRLTGQPLTPKPALGTLRKMPPRERKQDFSSNQVKAQQVSASNQTADTQSANTPQATHAAPPKNPRVLPLSIVNGIIIGILSSIIAGVLQKYVFDTGFLLRSLIILLIFIVVSLFVGLVLEDRKISIPFNRWVAILVTGTLVFGLILTFVYDAIRPPTTYFLVDATVEMAPLFNEVSTEVRNSVILNSRIGLRVYGGNISDTTGCGNTKLLIDPNAYTDPGTKLQSNLSLIEPSGHSSLVGAVLAALLNDLSSHDEPVKLVIITSGTDPVCDPQEGGILQSVAENIKSNINIVIISIGNLNTQEAGILESYAQAFHGGYVNIPTAAQLPQVVQTISSYGSRDYLYSRLTPTPTR